MASTSTRSDRSRYWLETVSRSSASHGAEARHLFGDDADDGPAVVRIERQGDAHVAVSDRTASVRGSRGTSSR